MDGIDKLIESFDGCRQPLLEAVKNLAELTRLSTDLAPADLSEEGRLAGIVAVRLKEAAKELD